MYLFNMPVPSCVSPEQLVRLCDLDPSIHAGSRMGKHVAMKQPLAGVVGDKGDFERLVRQAQDRVAHRTQAPIGADLPEMHAVKMHGVGKNRVIHQF